MMYKQNKISTTTISQNTTYEGERIEEKIMRIVHNKEPITDGAPLIYTDRKDGVQPEYDIRSDRFEIAVDAMDAIHKSSIAKREAFHKDLEEKNKSQAQKDKEAADKAAKDKNAGGESTQAPEAK